MVQGAKGRERVPRSPPRR